MLAAALLLLAAQLPTDTQQLQSALKAVRNTSELSPETYAKLRETYFTWLDARIAQGRTLTQINTELQTAGLLLESDKQEHRRPGYLEPLATKSLAHAPKILAIQAIMHRAMECAWDGTLLLYSKTQRVATLRALADTGTEPYVLLSADAATQASGALLLGTLWQRANCSSTWNGQYLRIHSIQNGKTTSLLERDIFAQLRENETATVGQSQVQFRYNGAVYDSEILSTPVLANYRITGNTATREAPYALTRAGFLVEWATLHPDAAPNIEKGFTWGTIARCPGPSTYQIETRPHSSRTSRFFKIEGSQPAIYRMLSVNPTPDPACKPLPESRFFDILVKPLTHPR